MSDSPLVEEKAKASSTLVALRVPSEILELLDSRVKEESATNRKANRSQLILDALEAYLSPAALDGVSQGQATSNISQTLLDTASIQGQIESAIAPLELEVEDLRGKLPA